jgi:TonB family protein
MPRREIVLVITVAVLVLVMRVQLRRSERMPPMSATMVFAAAPPTPPPQRCFAVGFPGRPPRKVVDVKPAYPQAARDRHVTGTVIIAATIDENGRVIRAEVLRSIEMLDTAALEAVKERQFVPATLHGTAVCLTMSVAVSFAEEAQP